MKININDNYRVVVYVDDPLFLGAKDQDGKNLMYLRDANKVRSNILRHVDGATDATIECDTTEICSHCGNAWEVNEDPNDKEWELGMPMCCEDAIKEFELASSD
ncbi:MAG: hypothetical protein OEX12_05815 [Gammaproteobacteria bacterium]|nr:hypothetical protein [Gammaproteobacteria bacterium]